MNRLFLLLFWVGATGLSAQAQNFVYRPVNPNFGGNTFNYPWLLSQAQVQDRTVDPNPQSNGLSTARSGINSLENYQQNLQNQILNRITSNLINDQFGEGSLREGTYQFGDFQIEISNATDGVVVRIVDGRGGETTITVPYY